MTSIVDPLVVDTEALECVECITVIAGGFAPLGGVETLVHDLVLALHARGMATEVICWGAKSPLLADIQALGVKVWHTRFRWGCRWGAPDRLMFTWFRGRIRKARLVVFPKLLRSEIHLSIKRMQLGRGFTKAILITPYRPAEMWAETSPSAAFLECFDAIITQSPAFETDLRSFGYRGIVSQLPYIPPACNPVVSGPPSLTIGFLGRLVPDKRIPYLLEAISSIRNERDIRLDVFGDGPLRSDLEGRAVALGIAGISRFHGSVSRNEIDAAIDSCTLFAFTSRTEGQCLAAMEILARGRPIVATGVGLFPELFEDRCLGRVGAADDPHSFGQSILELAALVRENPAFEPQSIQEQYETRFGGPKVLEGYLDLFRKINNGSTL